MRRKNGRVGRKSGGRKGNGEGGRKLRTKGRRRDGGKDLEGGKEFIKVVGTFISLE